MRFYGAACRPGVKGVGLTVSKYRFTTIVLVAALIVCAVGILILPQVDLPDFVLNPAKCPTIAKIHGKIGLSLFGEYAVRPTLNPGVSELSHTVLLVKDGNAFFGSNKAVYLRC